MAGTSIDINMRILLNASAGNTFSVIEGVTRALSGGGPGSLTGALAAVGIGAAVAFGVSAVKAAADYQQALLKVQALTGMTAQATQQMSEQILQMAPQVGEAPVDLANALYFVSSAGFRGADALNIMRLSAEAAATGNFDATVAADALTSALNSFGLKGNDAGNMMDILTQTVTQGKMEWSEFAPVVGQLATAARSAGISMQEAGAALATFTQKNHQTQKDTTYLSMLFLQLSTKIDTLAKNYDKLTGATTTYSSKAPPTVTWETHYRLLNGHLMEYTTAVTHAGVTTKATMTDASKAFDTAKFSAMDLQQKIAYLLHITSEHGETAQEQQAELLKMFGGNTRVLTSFNMLAQSTGAYEKNLQAINGAARNGKTTADAFAITQQGFNQQLKDADAAWQVLLITVGAKMLPVLTAIMQKVTPLIVKFADWFSTSKGVQAIMTDIGTFLEWTFTNVLMNLVNWTSEFVYWLNQSSGPANVVKGILAGIVAVVAVQKIGGMVSDLTNLATQAASFATGAGKQLLNILGGPGITGSITGNAQSADSAVKNLGADSATAGGEVKTMGADSATAAEEVGALGTDSATATGEVEALGSAAETASGEVNGLLGGLGKLGMLGLNLAGISLLGSQIGGAQAAGTANQTQTTYDKSAKVQSEVQALYKKLWPGQPWVDPSQWPSGMMQQFYQGWEATYPGQTPPFLQWHAASGGLIPGGWGVMNERGGEVVRLPSGSYVYPHGQGPGGHTFNFGDIHIHDASGNVGSLADKFMDEINRRLAQEMRTYASGFSTGGVI
jgi:hypothetical protein